MVAPTLTFAESYAAEDLVLQTARSLADELGLECVTAGAGAVLRLLAAAGAARAVVEIGTGTGVSGVWLLRGMRPDGVLTTIDREAEHQRIARRIFQEAGFAPGRTRIITGRALDVLPRLTDGGYDLAFLDAVKAEYPEYLEHALRLVRPGGVILADNVLWSGLVADPKVTDPDTEGLRAYARRIAADDRLDSVILAIGDGLAVSRVRRPEELEA